MINFDSVEIFLCMCWSCIKADSFGDMIVNLMPVAFEVTLKKSAELVLNYIVSIQKQYQTISLFLLTAVCLVLAKSWKSKYSPSIDLWLFKVQEMFKIAEIHFTAKITRY